MKRGKVENRETEIRIDPLTSNLRPLLDSNQQRCDLSPLTPHLTPLTFRLVDFWANDY